jgi:ABC-type multidrug transport system fused ATPase/permease subunit
MLQLDNQSSKSCFSHSFVIVLLPLLFLVGLVLGYLGILPLQVELHTLLIITFIFVVFLFFVRHNANYAACHMRGSFAAMEAHLQSELRDNALTIMGRTKSTLHVKDFMAEYYKDIRNDNFARVASSVFPMLGILGTFIAIAISMPNFSVTDTTALDHEISALLSGVGSAFFASIYGILLSLIWTYFEKRGLSKVEAYFAQIKEIFRLNVWSKDELTIHQHNQDSSKEKSFILALQETFNIDFIRSMNEEHMSTFREVMSVTNEQFKEISQHMQSVSSDLKDTISHIDHSKSSIEAKNQIEHTLLEFVESTRSLEKSTKLYNASLNNSLDRTFEKIDYEIANVVIKLTDFATHVALSSKEVQESIKSYHEIVAAQAKEK